MKRGAVVLALLLAVIFTPAGYETLSAHAGAVPGPPCEETIGTADGLPSPIWVDMGGVHAQVEASPQAYRAYIQGYFPQDHKWRVLCASLVPALKAYRIHSDTEGASRFCLFRRDTNDKPQEPLGCAEQSS